MHYDVLVDESADELAQAVNRQISNGWVPAGGIAVVNVGEGGYAFYQAMQK